MAKEEEKEEGKEGEAAAEGAAAPKSKKKLFIIIGVVLVLAIGGGAFFMLGGSKTPEEGAEHAEEHEEEHKHYGHAELPAFIVNLSETSNFLKIKLLLEYDEEILAKASAGEAAGGGGGGHGEGGSALPGALGHREPMIQDAVIRVLSSKKASDVLTVEGKEAIKEELLESINEASQLEEPPVVAVYFREFIVQ